MDHVSSQMEHRFNDNLYVLTATVLCYAPNAPLPGPFLSKIVTPHLRVSPFIDALIIELIKRGLLIVIDQYSVQVSPTANRSFDAWNVSNDAESVDQAISIVEETVYHVLGNAIEMNHTDLLRRSLPQLRYVAHRAIAQQREMSFSLASMAGRVFRYLEMHREASEFFATAIRLFDVSRLDDIDEYVAVLAGFSQVLVRQNTHQQVVDLVKHAFRLPSPSIEEAQLKSEVSE